ncbi:hypothetical protein [Gilvibacter sp.]|uniref:hypothetical protein n=1 Tax=Gilvibacter sp. TaxID=2729997 RepID=UPI0025BE89F0|nr:hypothetical protein [Gilvibacter sp.]NQX78020.1 hypothetical protein [Gilvibacter sp.]
MKIKILRFFLFACAICSGQTSGIELPVYKGEYRSVSTPYYPIYILKSEEIVLFNDTIAPEQLPKLLYKGIPGYGSYMMIPKAQVHLIVDKDVSYSIVDEVKTQIASTAASRLYFYYRASNENGISSRIKAIRYPNYYSYFKLDVPAHMLLRSELPKQDSSLKSIEGEPPIPPKPNHINIATSVEKAIYSKQQDVIDEALAGKKCTCLTLERDRIVQEINDGFVEIRDEALNDLMSEYDVVFLKFDQRILYQDYFDYLIQLEAIQDLLKKVEIIELSKEIREIHKDVGIRLPCSD